ncbi:RICIN domain-containing protein [Nocardia sp. NPDC049526]|uniref:RICIN domain-containing protein n=1 Tax=Nocardia sp. NPDC049526 TaxID=3364316 RepID=UPI0037B1DE26
MRKIIVLAIGILAAATAAPATAAPSSLPTGVFRLQNVNSGKCMDAAPRFKEFPVFPTSRTLQMTCQDDYAQHWFIDGAGAPGTDKKFVLTRPGKSALCLDVENGSRVDGAPIRVMGCENIPAQVWTPVYLGNNMWKFRSGNTDNHSCLDVDHGGNGDGDPLHQWTCLDVPQQNWRFLPPR